MRVLGKTSAGGLVLLACSAAFLTACGEEDFKNDPLIKRALEIFKGTIVEVRA